MSEIHLLYNPSASATNVINYSGQRGSNSPGQNAATGNVPSAVIEEPDNTSGTNSVSTPNEGSGIVLGTTTENSQVQKTVKGRFDSFTVVSNPA